MIIFEGFLQLIKFSTSGVIENFKTAKNENLDDLILRNFSGEVLFLNNL